MKPRGMHTPEKMWGRVGERIGKVEERRDTKNTNRQKMT